MEPEVEVGPLGTAPRDAASVVQLLNAKLEGRPWCVYVWPRNTSTNTPERKLMLMPSSNDTRQLSILFTPDNRRSDISFLVYGPPHPKIIVRVQDLSVIQQFLTATPEHLQKLDRSNNASTSVNMLLEVFLEMCVKALLRDDTTRDNVMQLQHPLALQQAGSGRRVRSRRSSRRRSRRRASRARRTSRRHAVRR